MKAHDRFQQFLKSKNLRHSAPRDAVVRVFLKTEQHVTTQELFELVRQEYPRIGYATVARTLRLLAESAICRAVDFADGAQRFEHEYGHKHHDHLVCAGCGACVEIYSNKLEKLQEDLVREHGYEQVSHKLQIFGICPKCQKKRKQ